MKRAVLDTSAVIRLYIPDGPVPRGLADAVDGAARGDVTLLAPELLFAEVAQVLWKKEARGQLTAPESAEILEAIVALPITLVSHRVVLAAATEAARQRNVSVYDALFLATARAHDATLFTADDRLQAAADKRG